MKRQFYEIYIRVKILKTATNPGNRYIMTNLFDKEIFSVLFLYLTKTHSRPIRIITEPCNFKY